MKLFALLALTAVVSGASVATLKFGSVNGKSTQITWTGSKLTVPQHCRLDTCDAIENALQAQAAENLALRKLISKLTANISELTDRVAANELAHTADANALRDAKAEYEAADIKLQAAVDVVTKMQGPKGETGQKGEQGIQGIQGIPGIQGPTGQDGLTGAPGQKGEAGTNGTDGVNGANGADGSDGAKGAPGAPGQKGEAGANGVDGVNGSNGAPGQKGARGANGSNGANGAKGQKGEQGKAPAPTEPVTDLGCYHNCPRVWDASRGYRTGGNPSQTYANCLRDAQRQGIKFFSVEDHTHCWLHPHNHVPPYTSRDFSCGVGGHGCVTHAYRIN